MGLRTGTQCLNTELSVVSSLTCKAAIPMNQVTSEFPFLIFLNLLIVILCECVFAYIYVCISCACLVTTEARRGLWIPWK